MKVTWDENSCTHSGICVQTLPEVFKIENGEFVIDTSQENEKIVIATVRKCPSGALEIKE